jgi:hypothetical protein
MGSPVRAAELRLPAGRGCHDAIEAIFTVCKGKNPKRSWVLDANLTAAFDRIDQDQLLDHLHGFPPGSTWLSGCRPV